MCPYWRVCSRMHSVWPTWQNDIFIVRRADSPCEKQGEPISLFAEIIAFF
jgi:hypothetical protein